LGSRNLKELLLLLIGERLPSRWFRILERPVVIVEPIPETGVPENLSEHRQFAVYRLWRSTGIDTHILIRGDVRRRNRPEALFRKKRRQRLGVFLPVVNHPF